MNRIGIFGLTGDPFTIAHRDICKQAMDNLDIDKLYIIPTVVNYHRKGKELWLTDLQKVYCMENMLWHLGSRYNGEYEIDTHELILKNLCNNDQSLYTEIIKPRRFIHTLLDFKSRMANKNDVDGGYKITLILGSDELRIFQSWHRWDAIINNIDSLAIVDGRNGEMVDVSAPVQIKLRGKVQHLSLSTEWMYRISASKIRDRYRDVRCGFSEYLKDLKEYDYERATPQELGWLDDEEKPNSVEKFVTELEEAHEATKGSQMVFK